LPKVRFSRRQVLRAAAAIAGALAASKPARPARAQARAVAAEPITPALLEAAKKEGKLAFYTAMDLPVAEKFAKTFEARFPGITVRVERSGAERVFQRIGQEMESRIHAVDVVNSADGAHFIAWKRNTWLRPIRPRRSRATTRRNITIRTGCG
jgi:iron(III) transport system substrate-binding protein